MKKFLISFLIITGILLSSNTFATNNNQFTIDDYCSVSNDFYTTFIPKVMNKTFTEGNSRRVKNYVNSIVTEKNFTTQDEDTIVLQDSSTGKILASSSDSETALNYLFMKVYPKFRNDTFIQLLSPLD